MDEGGDPSQLERLVSLTKQIFDGKKERRRSSAEKSFLNSGINIPDFPVLVKMLAKYNDSVVEFADKVHKINKRNKMQVRWLVITDRAIYNVDPSGFKLKRRIPIELLGGISLSTLTDNFFVLRIPSEYDYLLISPRKVEIVTRLVDLYAGLHSNLKTITVELTNSYEYRPDPENTREVEMTKTQVAMVTNQENAIGTGGVNTAIYANQKKGGGSRFVERR